MTVKEEEEEGFLTLKGINKTFHSESLQHTKAVDNFSVSIQKGELLTLLGPSGCGKTTVLRILSGFEDADSGSITLDNENIHNTPASARNMPLIFQSYALFPHLTVFENIAYGLKIKKTPPRLINNDVEMILHVVNLTGLEHRYPRELSGGQQQRTALARALILKPSIILFDEPLSNLDMKLRIQTRLEIKQIQQSLGITAVYVTHDQEEALSIADRIVVMNEGRVIQVGSPTSIYNTPNSVFVADFIGNTNFIEAMISKTSPQTTTVSALGQQIDLPSQAEHKQFRINEDIYLTIKPEAVIICKNSDFRGKVAKASFLGHHIQYEIELGNSFIIVTVPNTSPKSLSIREGNIVALEFPLDCLRILKK
jgi:iron(III) transport system ATP-binding protein